MPAEGSGKCQDAVIGTQKSLEGSPGAGVPNLWAVDWHLLSDQWQH